jgi:hypothetical protein
MQLGLPSCVHAGDWSCLRSEQLLQSYCEDVQGRQLRSVNAADSSACLQGSRLLGTRVGGCCYQFTSQLQLASTALRMLQKSASFRYMAVRRQRAHCSLAHLGMGSFTG